MPVRIYDIAKRHGISSKEVIEKLVESGFLKADQKLKPSSTIDKVTAQELEKLLPQLEPKVEDNRLAESGGSVVDRTVAAEASVIARQEASVSTVPEHQPVIDLAQNAAPVVADGVEQLQEETKTADQIISTVSLDVAGAETLTQDTQGKAEEATLSIEKVETLVPSEHSEEGLVETAVETQVSEPAPSTVSECAAIEIAETEKSPIQEQEISDVLKKKETQIDAPVVATKAVEEAEQKIQKEEIIQTASAVTDENARLEVEAKPGSAEAPPSGSAPAAVSVTAPQVQPSEKPQTIQPEQKAPPRQPGIGDVVGRIDISKFKDKQKEKEKERHRQKPQDQKKGAQPASKQVQPQKQSQPVAKAQPAQAKPVQQQKSAQQPRPVQQQQQGKKQVQGPVTIVKPPVSKDGKPIKSDKVAKLPPDAPVVSIKPPISVRDLADKLNKKPFQVIGQLVNRKIMANVNALVEEAVAREIAAHFGVNLVIEKRGAKPTQPKTEVKAQEIETDEDEKKLQPRPPVVTIMGHVDHGKTTLLDAIRKSNVVATEAGGITQHIGAYTVTIPHPDDKKRMMNITFLDTPGHAAFSAMRARGANVTDIVVLVVAADDGVMPQTVEALNHAKAANVPIIVAVNKCDHPNANPMRVREQLSRLGLTPDEWQGDTIFVDVSALKKQNIDKLLEMIVLKAELMELKANPDCPAKGFVIESALEPGGPAVTLLIKRGTLRVGDVVLCGQYFGKARALINEKNERLKEAGPSFAVKMLGLNGVPEPGQAFEVVESLDKAREIAEARIEELKLAGHTTIAKKITLETLLQQIEANQAKVLKVVIKADTQGSVEAICGALKDIKSEKVSLEIIHSGVGPVSESDVMLASAAKGIVIGFHTKLEHGVSEIAKREGVQIKLYTIIYELIDEVKKAMAGLLEPVTKEVVLGRADVKKVFELSKGGKVAGCMVRDGVLTRGRVRVYRGKDLIYDGVVASLRHFQEEVNEIRAGMECGVRIEGFNDFREGDVIECYNIEKTLQDLN